MIVGRNEKGLFSQVITDKTAPERFDTMRKTVDYELQKIVENRARQRTRRTGDMEEGQARNERIILLIEEMPESAEEEAAPENPEIPDELDVFVEQSYSCYHSSHLVGIKQVKGTLSCQPCILALDDCSTCNSQHFCTYR